MTLDTPKTRTQCERIKYHLLSGREITQLEAFNRYACFRLGARIHDLRKEGMDIKKRMVKTPGGAYVASYFLEAHQLELVG